MGDEDPEVAGEEEAEEEQDIGNSDVCTKYREAAKICDLAIQGLILQAQPGAKVLDLCKFGDTVIDQKCTTVYTKKVKGKPVAKGVAFPTCVSVNECVCHNSPLESDAAQPPLAEGDMVKIDVGCHIDGFISVAAHTFIVGAQPTPEKPLTGLQADLLTAANVACDVAVKLMRPGNTNSQVTQAMSQIAEAYGVNAVAGVLSHRMKRFVIDGNKVIIMREEVDQKVDSQTFEANEAYSVDLAFSTGDGKPREAQSRTTVFKRAVDKNYRLKIKASRYLINEVNQKYPALPFAIRMFDDERQARMGVVELLKHELVQPFPVLYEKKGDYIAHFKFTVLLLSSGTVRITGLPAFAKDTVKSEKTNPDDINAILSLSSKKKKKSRGGGKKKKADDEKTDD